MMVTFLLLLGLTVFFLVVGRLLAGTKGMIGAFLFALIINGTTYWFSDSIVLRAYNAQPVPENHRLVQLTSEIAKEANLPMPKVYILPSDSPNAFATGRNPEHAAVAATTGILHILNDDELKAVMAHEMGHIKNRDTLTSTIAASIAGGAMILSRVAFLMDDREGGFLKTLAISIIAPVAARIITMAISRDREYAADEYAAAITKKPMMLASALQKLEDGVKKTPMPPHNPETSHMFIVNPFSDGVFREIFSTHPPIHKRIERLKEFSAYLL